MPASGVKKGGWISDDSADVLDLIVRAEVQRGVKQTRLVLEAL